MNDERIEELRGKLQEARKAYYNLTPKIADQEYDALKDELLRLSPNDPEIAAVGAFPSKYTVWEKVEHKIPMGSLNKVNETTEFIEWVHFTGIHQHVSELDDPLLITHKIDGSSLEVVYEDGKLVRAVTRGNGKIGEDVTVNVTQIPNLPKSIPIKEEIIVRGEIVMLKDIFEQYYSEQYANPRNTAAGKIRDKKSGGKDCQNLTFMAFTLMSATAPNFEDSRFQALQAMGFNIPNWTTGHMNDIIQAHKLIDKNRDKVPYEIDGTVIRIRDIRIQEEMGDLNMRPYGQIAWKFDPAMGVTKVIDIRWQVGTSSGGRITPVAQIEPVQIGGVTISSVSLHNLAFFKNLGLWKGCEVLVSRRNDVIPYIERNLSREKLEDDGSDI
jgi:DNA ligase (NAD+)